MFVHLFDLHTILYFPVGVCILTMFKDNRVYNVACLSCSILKLIFPGGSIIMIHRGIAVVAICMFMFTAHIATAGTIQLPMTGQALCYDTTGNAIDCAGTGQDGMSRTGVAWPAPRFTITYCDNTGPCMDQTSDCDANSSTDIVTDNLTGLVWVRNVGSTLRAWQDSITHAENMSLCGHSDWRMPNLNEMQSLYNNGVDRTDMWLQEHGFALVPFGDYQTSTMYAPNPARIWTVNIGFGYTGFATRGSTLYVIPVRGPDVLGPAPAWITGQASCYNDSGVSVDCTGTGQDGDYRAGVSWPSPRFTVGHGAEADCITDELTGLMWAKTPPDSFSDWQGAFASVNITNLCGYDDWRVPNAIEQRSLFTYEGNPYEWLNGQGFSAVPASRFWTSTTFIDIPNYAMTGITNDGLIMFGAKDSSFYTWPVRGGEISYNGTMGTQVTIYGSGFGIKKGKVLIGGVSAKIGKGGWSETRITCTVAKPPLPAESAYPVTVVVNKVPTNLKETFTVKNLVLDDLTTSRGKYQDSITVTGMFFGTKKGKVYLYDPANDKKKNLKVTYWRMIPATGASVLTFQAPKPSKTFPAGSYPLKVASKIGGIATASTAFVLEE